MAASQLWWRAWPWLRHPLGTFWWHWKWWNRPGIGEVVEDCATRRVKVVAFGDSRDDLVFEDGTKASWMHCCNHLPREHWWHRAR